MIGAPEQPFARGQGRPFLAGPFLGGYVHVLAADVAAAGSVTFAHTLRVVPRHVEVISPIVGEYPSRVRYTAVSRETVTVEFESGQSAGAALWLY